MATNWPPTVSYPSWPPAELEVSWLSFSTIQVGVDILQRYGFTRDNPTSQENQDFFKNVRCDENHPCSGIILISPLGVRYPIAYCTGANHKSALVLWIVGYDSVGEPCYDLGWGSGEIIP